MSLKNNSVFFTDGEKFEDYSISNQFSEHLEFILVRDKVTSMPEDAYYALSLSVRDRLVRNWLRTQQRYKEKDVKRVYYLSLEFLMGRLLGNALINMNYYDECYNILKEDGYGLEDIRDLENDMALGNGGLGRLAACYLDSMATLGLPAFGYGIRYEYGIFKQEIVNGWQFEKPDNWLSYGNPWEILRRNLVFRVKFYGNVKMYTDQSGRLKFNWLNTQDVYAVAFDVPVPGYGTNTVNNLRLWQAKATNEFDFQQFNSGNYIEAVESKNISENISKALYPNDTITQGKFLRLKQQYFFTSATLQDIIRKYKINHDSFDQFPQKTAIQLNDTHPVIAIPELMRLLIDEYNLEWDKAWEITLNTFGYTNHTVVPEALEEWPVSIWENLLPRHLQIVYEINRRFLEYVRNNFTNDNDIIAELSIIREGAIKAVKMAHLAIVGCHSVNGVAELHTNILKEKIFPQFYKIFPKKFINITNGITPRRWLKTANPLLSGLITDKIGSGWVKDLSRIREIEDLADDAQFRENWRSSKWLNKRLLIKYIEGEHDIKVNAESVFDAQIKRFHEYKRQLLNVFHIITLYNRIKENPSIEIVPRTVIFAGKAAPAYYTAKLVIKLINSVAETVNNDREIGDKLKVIFLKDYSVTLAEKIIPASDLSEQISTAGFEASGTGNMKFALNGALTIGTMDGANIEIREEVGKENIFIFGLNADQISNLKQNGYNPMEYYDRNKELRKVVDLIASGFFNKNEPGIFDHLIEGLMRVDYYCLFADYESYVNAQESVSRLYLNTEEWTRKSILNLARIGKFSSDRSVNEYAKKIWHVKPVKVSID